MKIETTFDQYTHPRKRRAVVDAYLNARKLIVFKAKITKYPEIHTNYSLSNGTI